MFFNSFKGSIFFDIYGHGKPFLLLHGLGGTHDSMIEIAGNLDGFSVILPDLPNHGQSEDIEATMDDISEIFIDLMNYLNYEKFFVGGLSLGSLIAQNMALRYPEKIEKLILISPGIKIDDYAMNTVMTWFDAEDGGASTTFSKEYYEKNKNEILEYNKRFPFDPSRLAGIASDLINFDLTGNKINVSCLSIIGDQDIIFGPRIIQDLKNIYSDCRIEIIKSGHAIHRESPRIASKLIKEFLLEKLGVWGKQ